MPPESATDPRTTVGGLLSAVTRRRWWRHFADTVLVACCGAATLTVAATLGDRPFSLAARNALSFVIAAAAMAWSRRYRSRQASALALERARAEFRNVLVTAEELERHPDRASSGMTARVFSDAAARAAGLRSGDIVPAWRIALPLAAALALSVRVNPPAVGSVQQGISEAAIQLASSLAPGRLTVRIEPPGYTGRPSTTVTNPARLEVLAGSRVRFGVADLEWRVRFGSTAVTGPWHAIDSGYFALEHRGVQRRLIPVDVIPDRAPAVRIETPAKDLILPDGSRSIPMTIVASDDLALQMLELRFTKISGSGERFEFQEGSQSVRVHRVSERNWRATASLALGNLNLAPGDSLVYRAVARDARAGDRGLGTSDRYFVEIAGPGQAALAGVEMPPDMERYALSQQMVVQKIERLRARESSLPREAVTEASAGIAAEQRAVRANFIFLLGGHVEDEEVEAEQSHEIQEGRLENTARRDINAAISHMTRAEQGLAAINTAAALPPAKLAVEALQRAFGRSRYLLRSLGVRSRLDPSRRLTGDVERARDWRRRPPPADARPGDRARALFARVLDTATAVKQGRHVAADAIRSLAESALAIDPASERWRNVAERLLGAASTATRSEDVARALDDALTQIAPEAARGLVRRGGAGEASLSRAWRAEQRR